jgi:hypothetical protein
MPYLTTSVIHSRYSVLPPSTAMTMHSGSS